LSEKSGEDANTEIQQDFISTSWQDHEIHILANSDLLWDNQRGEAILYGNVIHEMLAGIHSEKDIPRIVVQFIAKGLVQKSDASEIEKLLSDLVSHIKLKPHFEADKIIFTEREIITKERQILIPDRLIFKGQKVAIVDYKTGKPDKKHVLQIENYAHVLKEMNFEVSQKLLVYLDKKIEIIEV
jgi:hypothetical protein